MLNLLRLPPSLLLIPLQITYLDEYYLTNYEIELLRKSSAEIASQIPEGSMIIELGSGLVKFPYDTRYLSLTMRKKPPESLFTSTGL